MEILARFDFDKLNHAQDNNPHLVVSLKAPRLDWIEKRQELAIIPCVDLSGSMQGDKLRYAKQSIIKLIEHLADGDYAGLVVFANHARVVVPPARVDGDLKDKLRQAVEGLGIEGGTNLADGLTTAVDVVQNLDLPVKFLQRVIVFTDGMPTVGLTDTKAILKILGKRVARATVSAFGYGAGNGDEWGGIDQDFLTELSVQGKGNYAYVKDPDDALGAFGKELGGLLSTFATNLRLEIQPRNDHRIGKMVTNVEHEEDVTGIVEIPISDILGEETRHFVFETALTKQKKVFPRDTPVFNVSLSYDVLTEDGSRETREAEGQARVRFVREDDVQTKPHASVDEVVALHQTIRAQLEAEEQAKQGNFVQAVNFMQVIEQQVALRGHENIAAAAQQAGLRMQNDAAYVSNRGYLTSFVNGGTRGQGTSAVEPEAAGFLADCNVDLNSPAQTYFTASFTGGNKD